MDGRHHDVGGRLPAELHDPLAEVRVPHLDAVRLEVLVEMALLGEHRLALHQPRHAVLAQDPVHDAVVLVGIARPVHRGACGSGVPLELFQIFGKARERMRLDLRAEAAKLLPLRDEAAGDVPLVAHEPDRLVVPVQARIVLDELRGPRRVLGHRVASSSSSATCRTRSFLPSRRMKACRNSQSSRVCARRPATRSSPGKTVSKWFRTMLVQLPDGQTTCSYGAKTSSILRASGRASSKKPEFAIGWPQHVCASGKWTVTPCRSRTSAVASPTRG